MLERGAFNVGEMAHIIAHSEGGPRGRAGGGSDAYPNLILLCPTCHKKVDKAPEGEFTEEMLLRWKVDHEREIRSGGKTIKFETVDTLKQAISLKLLENRHLWETLGPQSEAAKADPGSNLARVWDLKKLDTIIPNNYFIMNCIESNIKLLTTATFKIYLRFKAHACTFEQNQYGRLDQYPLFPREFAEEFCDE